MARRGGHVPQAVQAVREAEAGDRVVAAAESAAHLNRLESMYGKRAWAIEVFSDGRWQAFPAPVDARAMRQLRADRGAANVRVVEVSRG